LRTDVVISNCVINLSVDKPKVLSEMFRVLAPGGRIGISDVVAEDHLTAAERADHGSYVGCIAGACHEPSTRTVCAAAGFVDASVRFTHQAGDGMRSAIIQAIEPRQAAVAAATAGQETAAAASSHGR
jgi:SAM-dependent methyltransferase